MPAAERLIKDSDRFFIAVSLIASDIESTEQYLTVSLVSNDSGNIIIPVL